MGFSLILRTIIVGLCGLIVFSGHPPAHSQVVLSSEDAVQDSNIAGIDRHLEATDRTVTEQGREIQSASSTISEMQGEQRVFFAVLGVLTSGSIAFQVKSKRP